MEATGSDMVTTVAGVYDIIYAMKNSILVFIGLVAGIAAANEPHAKGRLALSFKESDPVGDFAEMKRRVPSRSSGPSSARRRKKPLPSRRSSFGQRAERAVSAADLV